MSLCRHLRLASVQPRPSLLAVAGVRFNSNAATDLVSAIRTALKDSMRAKDTFKSGVLKVCRLPTHSLILDWCILTVVYGVYVQSALGEIQTASYAAQGQSAPSATKTLLKSIKKRHEAIDTFLSSGRQDLAKAYENELEVLKAFVSEQATPTADELEGVVKAALEKLGLEQGDKQAMGKLMKSVKEALPDVDGRQLAETAKKVLSA